MLKNLKRGRYIWEWQSKKKKTNIYWDDKEEESVEHAHMALHMGFHAFKLQVLVDQIYKSRKKITSSYFNYYSSIN